MAQLGYVLGGQLHLLRYLGWHRDLLESRLGERLRAKSIRWLDFGFGGGPEEADRELAGLEFLPAHAAARRSWQSIWPTGMHPVTWDAIGGVASARGTKWILVEAKAHLGELQSNCESKNWRDGLSLIADAMARTQNALGVPMEADWLRGYYRYASRLAALNFLLAAGEKAQLLTICFCGGQDDARRKCPKTPHEWESALAARDRHLQLPPRHRLSGHLHKLFLDVRPQSTQSLHAEQRFNGVGELVHEA